VSHMMQSRVHGKEKIKFLESLTVADVHNLSEDTGCLTLFTNERGGIEDDLIVTRAKENYLSLVTNAGCRDKDTKLMLDKASELKR